MFEAVGLANEIVDRCFKGTKTRSQGTDFNALYCDLERLHHLGYLDNSNIGSILVQDEGQLYCRDGGLI